LTEEERKITAAYHAAPDQSTASFQTRVASWMGFCFGAEISADKVERNHRFLEEALELVQANGCQMNEAFELVNYVFGRPVGDLQQEVGGVMVTLAALCLASGADMHQAGESELHRVWQKVEQIRAKQAAKPKYSPLPQITLEPDAEGMLAELGAAGLHDIAARFRAMNSSLAWIVEKYMPPEGSGCDSRGVPDFVVAAAGGLCGIEPMPRSEVQCHGLDTPERVCFYEQDFYVLSNFSSFEVEWTSNHRFKTAEHCYHWLRFATGAANGRLGGAVPSEQAMAVADAVQRATSAHDAFKIAQENKHLQRADWNDVKVEKMRMIIRAKALQHEYVRRKLLATGDRELVENSWRDDFWGWGPNRTGQNMLGRLWMDLRAELRTSLAAAEH